MSTIISWQKRFTRSKRNWKRRDAHEKKIATLWPQPGHSSLDCLSPTPCARHNLFGLQVSTSASLNSELNFDKNIKWPCLPADGPVSMPNMPNQMMNRMQVPQGMSFVIALSAIVTMKNKSLLEKIHLFVSVFFSNSKNIKVKKLEWNYFVPPVCNWLSAQTAKHFRARSRLFSSPLGNRLLNYSHSQVSGTGV